jgi:hypothetical protein
MKSIRKVYNDKTYQWDPSLYGKGGWMLVNPTGKLSIVKKDIQTQLGVPTEDQFKIIENIVKKDKPKRNLQTKTYKNEVYAWDPEIRGGRWFVLGTKGGLVHEASAALQKKLGRPVEKEKEIEVPKEDDIDDDLDESNLSERVKKYREQDASLAQANIIKSSNLGSLISQKMISGESLGKSLKSSISDKIKANLESTKQKFNIKTRMDPLNLARSIGGDLGVALAGKLTKRSVEDQEYFMKYPNSRRRKRSLLDTKLKNTKDKKESDEEMVQPNKDPLHTKISPGKVSRVNKNDALADVLAKLYNLTLRMDEEQNKRLELENNFKKEREEEQQRFLKELVERFGNGKQLGTNKVEKIKEEEEKSSLWSSIVDILSESGGMKRASSILRSLGSYLISPPGLAMIGMISLHGFKTDINKKARKQYEADPEKFSRENTPYQIDPDVIMNWFKKDRPNDSPNNLPPNPLNYKQFNSDTIPKPSSTPPTTSIQPTSESNDINMSPLNKALESGDKILESSKQFEMSTFPLSNQIINAPTTNIINGGGSDIGVEQLTGVRTNDTTLMKIYRQNYRFV